MSHTVRARGSRGSFANLVTKVLKRRTTPLDEPALERSSVVFSPHFDDETLGCGGTVLRKRALGADVKLVFLTDGRASHREWLPEEELVRVRTGEGRAAAKVLGLGDADVHALGFEETRLDEHIDEASVMVRELLEATAPEQVFVPYRFEPPADHAATFEIVSRALRSFRGPVAVFEYPIWVWVQWPWTDFPEHSVIEGPRALVRQWRSLRRFFTDFRWRVDTSDFAAQKLHALEQHRSQLFRPSQHPDWPILGDVRGGDFLRCFLRDFEVFARIPIAGVDGAPRS